MSRQLRREVPEAIGLSVMDLVCGLFGLLVVLFATSDRRNGQIGIVDAPLRFLRAQAQGGEPVVIGLQFKLDKEVFQSWPDCADRQSVRWATCEPGRTEGITNSEKQPSDIAIAVLRRSDGRPLNPTDYKIRVSTPDRDYDCEIKPDGFYRTTIKECR